MNMIDVNKNMGEDAPEGFSSEVYCEKLHDYHKALWSKKLPSGFGFNLSIESIEYEKKPKQFFLRQISSIGTTDFSSDWMCNTFLDWIRMQPIKAQLSNNEVEDFEKISTRIGNYIIFPKGTYIPPDVKYGCQTKNRPWGINRARGCDEKICDRFDLTLECIRLWYDGIKETNENPLADAMDYSKGFFDLFDDFKRYIEFFLLDDLVDKNYSQVRFFLPFDSFDNNVALPQNVNEYRKYIKAVTCFIKARNYRIAEYDAKQLMPESPHRS
jgi:hypothetical protein